jgi:uncharacterized protein (TIGR00645 family)
MMLVGVRRYVRRFLRKWFPPGWLLRLEHRFEKWFFRGRWLLLPAYAVLVGVLAILALKSVEEFIQLLGNLRVFDESRTILQALTIVDVVLVMNLVLMVMFVGYTNFVSKFDFSEFLEIEGDTQQSKAEARRSSDIPPWLSLLDYSGLKVQLMGSIIAISSITTLRVFLEMTNGSVIDGPRMLWTVVVYLVFLLAALIIAVINRLKHVTSPSMNMSSSPLLYAARSRGQA